MIIFVLLVCFYTIQIQMNGLILVDRLIQPICILIKCLIPNIEYGYNEPDFKTGYLGLMKTSEGYERLGDWSNPARNDVKLYDAQKREQNLVESGTYGNQDQFVYLFSHILENEELADKFLSPEPLRITIFNSACLYFGVDMRIAAELFPTWTASGSTK